MTRHGGYVARQPRRRGEPLMVLAMLLGGWVGARAMLWEGPPVLPAAPLELAGHQQLLTARPQAMPRQLAAVARQDEAPVSLAPSPALAAPARPTPPLPLVAQPAPPPPLLAQAERAPPSALQPLLPPRPLRAQVASAHAMLWLAAVSQMPLLDGTAATPLPPRAIPPRQTGAIRRWSGDSWLLLRGGGQGFGPAGALPTYGASQLGAVLRYRLDGGTSPFRPALYARISGALSGPAGAFAEREAALGLSARPLPGVPARVMVEARVSRFASGLTRVRPAASVVSEVAPITLPWATRAEFYAQAGYVGGPAATAFVDGQLRLDHRVARLGPAELRAGAGAWGGAQSGSARLDVGPGLTLQASSGAAAARLAMDWRLRVAGNAAPSSGPALTLSAGF